ncbi:TPA: ATP-dependent endonuclease [Candidatus Galligastranaerophilus intestinigallinarum]|nr:ATP-dependent endonuclease [Candidatus Galligastranaerophilus intestinigallinarum]
MKFKIPEIEYIQICLDRLTRFKPVSERYIRVIDDVLSKYLIQTDEKLSDIQMSRKIELAQTILNSAAKNLTDLKLNEIIKNDEEKIFYLTNEDREFLNSKIDFLALINLLDENTLPLNLKRLKFQNNLTSNETREKYATLFPVSKVVLVEGITEEILLIEFAKILGLDFKKEGIFVLGAGGKNQVARKYYKLIEEIKIPIFILLDSDAKEIANLIIPKLRNKDKLHLIKTGEFEDILTGKLIKNALNFHFAQNMLNNENEFEENGHAVVELHDCFKNNGWGEFKKADFAKIIREYLHQAKNPPVSDELKLITDEIKNL